MVEWQVTIPSNAKGTMDYLGRPYGAGDVYQTDKPCWAVAFAAKAEETFKINMRDAYPGAIDEIVEACTDSLKPQLGRQHDPDQNPPADAGTDGRRGPHGDGPQSLGAPEPTQDAGTIDRIPSGPGEPDERTPAEQAFDREAPADAGEIADRLADAGTPPDQIDSELERARRGEPQPGQPHPFRSKDQPEHGAAVSDPVDLFTGEFTITCTDVELPGRGFDFRFVRRYRSGRPAYGPFGFNWDHSYNVFLRELDDGGVAVWTGELREDVYQPDPAGGFRPPGVGRSASIEADRDPAGRLIGYRLTFRGGFVWEFRHPPGWTDGRRYPLVRAADRHGNENLLYYDSDGHLETVVDTVGRAIRFHYGMCGLLEAVIDPFGRRTEYHHAPDAERLVRVVPPVAGDGPRGDTRYEYADADHPALRNNIVAVWGPDREFVVENRYGDDPGSESWNRVVEQQTNMHTYRFCYDTLRYVGLDPESTNDAYRRVEVLEPDGTYRVYSFSLRGLLLDERTRLVADRSYRVWAVAYRYNANGDLIELRRPNGLTTRLRYDEDAADPRARGNLLEAHLVAPPIAGVPPRRLWSATYEPRFQEPDTITDETGQVTRYVYDYQEDPLGAGTGRLVRIEHPDATLPDGSTQASDDVFEYNDAGQAIRHRTPEGHIFEFSYHALGPGAGQLRRVVGGAGVEDEALTFGYDRFGYLDSITDEFGNAWVSRWDALGRLIERSAPAVNGVSATTRFRYSRGGDLVEVRRPRGAYDEPGFVAAYLRDEVHIDRRTHTARVVSAANTAEPRTTTHSVDHLGRTTRIVDPIGRRTRVRYDERGLPLELAVTPPTGAGRRVRYAYDRNGNVRRIRRGGAPDLACEYDVWDRLTATVVPAVDARTEYHYGPADRVRQVRVLAPPAPGQPAVELSRVELEYDERGRLTLRREAGNWQRYWYDRDDRLVRITDQRGRSVEMILDALGRARQITDPLSNRVRSERDRAGRLTDVYEDEVDPAGAVSTFHTVLGYDAAHRLTTVDDSDSHVAISEYDDRDLLVRWTGPGPERMDLSYDAFGDLIRMSAGPGATVHTGFARDGAGRVRAYTDPAGRRTTYEYAADDSWRSITLPDGRRRLRADDEFGRAYVEQAPSGATATVRYGPDGLPYRTTFWTPAGVVGLPDLVQFRDGLGRVVRLEQGTQWLSWRWDALGRLVAESSDAGTVAWRYDDVRGLADVMYPDGRVDRIELDPLDRPARHQILSAGTSGLCGLSAGHAIATYQYVGPERVARRGNGNGTAVTYGYDAARRLAMVAHDGGAGGWIVRVRYVYDARGRRRVVLVDPRPGGNTWYDYDGTGRLAIAAEGFSAPTPPPGATQAQQDAYLAALGHPVGTRESIFEYTEADGLKARIVATGLGTTAETYVLGPAGQILSATRGGAPPTPFRYHADGQRAQDDRFTYSYDTLGRLREVRDLAGASVLSLAYDPAGRQLLVAPAGAPARRNVWLGGRMVQQNAGGVPVQQLATGGHDDEPLVVSDGADRWLHADGRLSLLAVTDAAGTAIERYSYEPFGSAGIWAPDGVTPRATSAVGTSPAFGGYRQLVPGLFDAHARTYDAATSAFLQPDPRGYASGPNPYAFAGQNPVDFVDPTGEFVPVLMVGIAIGTAAGVGFSFYDAHHHPERYSGSFSWRALYQTYGGAVVGGLSALAGVVAGGITTSLLGGGTATAGGVAGLSVGGKFVVGGLTAVASGAVWSTGFHRMFPELVDKPSAGGAALDFATGGTLTFAGPVLRAVAPRLTAPVVEAVDDVAAAFTRARAGPWRLFGAQWGLLLNPRSTYRWWNMFYDNRARSTVLNQLRRSSTWVRNIDNSLQHLGAMESTSWVPRGFRNAGLNLMEVPLAYNSWMTNIPSRNIMLRIVVAAMAAGTALTSAELTTRVTGEGGGPLTYLWGDDTALFEGVDGSPPQAPPGATPRSTGEPDSGTGKP